MIECLDFLIKLLSAGSLIAAMMSWLQWKEKTYKCIREVCVANTIMLFLGAYEVPILLKLDIGFELLLFYAIAFIGGLIYIITAIVCSIRAKKVDPEKKPDSVRSRWIEAIVIAIPLIIFSAVFIKEMYLIHSSDLILVYTSRGNGGFDSHTFAYAVNDDHCEEFDIGTDFGGYRIESFLPKGMIESDSEYQRINEHGKKSIVVGNYYIEIDGYETHDLVICKNNELLHQTKYNSHYFNIDCESVYYRQ